VGYQRLEAPALLALERVHDLARDYVNFLHPVRRMTEKVRLGARVTRRYDTAQTPYRRLLASGCLSQQTTRQLARRSKKLDPLHLKLELESAQRTLAERAGSSCRPPPAPVGSFMRQLLSLWSDPLLRQDGFHLVTGPPVLAGRSCGELRFLGVEERAKERFAERSLRERTVRCTLAAGNARQVRESPRLVCFAVHDSR
jgi:hypothetical protein